MKFNLSDEEIEILIELITFRLETTPDSWLNDQRDKNGKLYLDITKHLLERLNLDLVEK